LTASTGLTIALIQFNPLVGDVAGNADRIVAAVRAAAAEQPIRVAVLPELALVGYPPDDLLLRPDFAERVEQALDRLSQALADTGVATIVGAPLEEGGARYNGAVVLDGGARIAVARKRCLPNYGVFDEKRYFVAAHEATVAEIDGRRLGLIVCEDIWEAEPARAVRAAGAEAIVCINASPFDWRKRGARLRVAQERASACGVPLLYLNQVGGQDELVFDGASFALDASASERAALRAWEQATAVVSLEANGAIRAASDEPLAAPESAEAAVYRAVALSIRDYIGQNGFDRVLVGLSGGIDSALTLTLAADALGPERVTAVIMPSRYTARMSVDDARELAERLGVAHETVSIEGPHEAFLEALAGPFAGTVANAAEENVQARSRGVLLMALANKQGGIVLSTGNKSELAVGYATLYGDMVGGLAPLKDVPKMRVYALARWRNSEDAVIPERIIERAPSAELAPNQADTDSLPAYEVLDPILEGLVERDDSVEDLVAAGYEERTVRRVARMLVASEHKRRQAAPGPKVSPRAFGRERRYPITARYTF
jgi:NAD+ synthase (glutamine-hydrolysing)